ncbi:hypothetical protein J5Y05_20975 [Streptomyces sp. RG38]|uniref:Integral membrane protein n=1 Tax=Streptomyces tagetis TaxID=2820809 RepID=A0A940XEQ2_9ACTN|nr:hypothetical protein [Streptomyces sp. RG38]MBQ0828948.1 hypothetical protein [Streptomyces sp. RG38]
MSAAVAGTLAALVLLLLLPVIVRLPWIGDLGMHAATVERLRGDLRHPGNPLVDADTPSPYYSPWTLLLGCVARVTGLSVFIVLRMGALVALTLLVTGVWRYVRTLSRHPAAPPLALLCLVLLWGTTLFTWSGFLALDSFALTVAYPSVLALGLALHLWAWLPRAVASGGWGTWIALGVLWAVILLVHQFSGVVASLGALATVLAARPERRRLLRPAVGLAAGMLVLWWWPYYDFFALVGAEDGLEPVHRALYRDLLGRYWLVLLGVAALGARFRRVRRDPLVLFFVLGVAVFAAGGLTGHWSWGRVLPAALIPAQLAAALEALEPARPRVRAAWATALAGSLAVGAWAQAGTVGHATGRAALPRVVGAEYRRPWTGYHWITPWVRRGDVVMARVAPSRQIPAYGAYTVAPGYPDVFLADAADREAAVDRYFAPETAADVRRETERRYGVRWVVDRDGALGMDAELREVARGPHGQVLYAAPGPARQRPGG